jgi:16S rRNA (adenine1518-N6/adenine1519-N6)-dimethyltransferase
VRAEPIVPPETAEALLRLVQAGFKQPRKQLRNSLADGLGWAPAQAEALLRRGGIDPSRRPQTLALAEWARLYEAMSSE